MTCSHVASCPLFRLFTLNASLQLWRSNYCDGRFESCERFKLSLAGRQVPSNMLPNGKMLGGAQVAAS